METEIVYLDRKNVLQAVILPFDLPEEIKSQIDGTVLLVKRGSDQRTDNDIAKRAWKAFCECPASDGKIVRTWGIFPRGTTIEAVTEWFTKNCPNLWRSLVMEKYEAIQKKYPKDKEVSVKYVKRVRTKDGIYRLAKIGDKYAIIHIYTQGEFLATQNVYCVVGTQEEAEEKLLQIKAQSKAKKRS